MLCWPGFWPVIIDDHATEEISGIEEHIFLKIPREISSAVLAMTPASAKSLSMPKGTPSRPIMTVFPFPVIISFCHSNYSAGTYVFILNKDEASQFLNVVEVFDDHGLFGFDNDFCNLKILDYFSVFGDKFER